VETCRQTIHWSLIRIQETRTTCHLAKNLAPWAAIIGSNTWLAIPAENESQNATANVQFAKLARILAENVNGKRLYGKPDHAEGTSGRWRLVSVRVNQVFEAAALSLT
jgi:hypothetical protein